MKSENVTGENITPAISVIVPVYNVEKYLKRCVDSVLAQTFTDFELILIDDGSKDHGGAICDHYAMCDDRVKVVHQDNAGVSSARNKGIEIAKGEFITFIDSDDYVDDNFFATAYNAIKENDSEVYISGLHMESINQDGIMERITYSAEVSRSYSVKELFDDLQVNYPQICICGPWCKLYSKELICRYNIRFLNDLSLGEDTYFNLDVLEVVSSVFFSNDVFYHYMRENTESLFSKFEPNTYEIHIRVYDKMRRVIEEKGCLDQTKKRFENMYFGMLLGGIHSYYRFSDKTTQEQRRYQIEKVAENRYVRGYKIGTIQSIKKKVQLVLLKMRAYGLINLIFKRHYSRRRHGS